MTLPGTRVFRKTAKGLDELKSRSHGLSPRKRQVLILADGRRDVAELSRMIPAPELHDCLSALLSGGFVETAVAGEHAKTEAAFPAAGDSEAEFAALRQLVVRALVDAIGPHGDELALAIERCRSRSELRELSIAAESVVEAILGREASARFAAAAGVRRADTGSAR